MLEVSVVMSVYNGAEKLGKTIESILHQEGVDFEFIIVNDGSTDSSTGILEKLASCDKRIRVFHQKNTGLTRALIRGCCEARGDFIARQDVGDISLPGRLEKELNLMNERNDVAMVSCGTRFVGPEEEFLFNSLHDNPDATNSLLTLSIDQLAGPSSHGSTMFRKDLYDKIGGYREEFRRAQDTDLWVRLAEIGRHLVVREILFQTDCSLDGISSGALGKQKSYDEKIIESAKLRRKDLSDSEILAQVGLIEAEGIENSSKQIARAAYFIGACLQKNNNQKAMEYYCKAFSTNPLHLKALCRYLYCKLRLFNNVVKNGTDRL